jgi:alkylation response protein AidB-like acyl-CoA dehydrogenase
MTGSGQDVTAFHAMKYRVSTAAKKVGQEALQLHGGMGLCDEVAVSHAFKRLTVIAQSFGNADQCLQRYVDGLA